MKNLKNLKELKELNAQKPIKKVLVVYHCKDLDGITSLMYTKYVMDALQTSFDIEVDYLGYDYEPLPTLEKPVEVSPEIQEKLITNKYDYYQFIDVTPPIEWFQSQCFNEIRNTKIDIFDHHQQRLETINDYAMEYHTLTGTALDINIIADYSICASKIYWLSIKYFVENFDVLSMRPNETYSWIFERFYETRKGFFKSVSNDDKLRRVKEIIEQSWFDYADSLPQFTENYVDLVDAWDTWKWYNNNPEKPNLDAVYLNMGFTLRLRDYEKYVLSGNTIHVSMDKLLTIGETVFKAEANMINIKDIANVKICGYDFAIVNGRYSLPTYLDIQKLGYAGVIFWRVSNDFDTVSLAIRTYETTEGTTALAISQLFDGGGHKHASGAKTSLKAWLNQIDVWKSKLYGNI